MPAATSTSSSSPRGAPGSIPPGLPAFAALNAGSGFNSRGCFFTAEGGALCGGDDDDNGVRADGDDDDAGDQEAVVADCGGENGHARY